MPRDVIEHICVLSTSHARANLLRALSRNWAAHCHSLGTEKLVLRWALYDSANIEPRMRRWWDCETLVLAVQSLSGRAFGLGDMESACRCVHSLQPRCIHLRLDFTGQQLRREMRDGAVDNVRCCMKQLGEIGCVRALCLTGDKGSAQYVQMGPHMYPKWERSTGLPMDALSLQLALAPLAVTVRALAFDWSNVPWPVTLSAVVSMRSLTRLELRIHYEHYAKHAPSGFEVPGPHPQGKELHRQGFLLSLGSLATLTELRELCLTTDDSELYEADADFIQGALLGLSQLTQLRVLSTDFLGLWSNDNVQALALLFRRLRGLTELDGLFLSTNLDTTPAFCGAASLHQLRMETSESSPEQLMAMVGTLRDNCPTLNHLDLTDHRLRFAKERLPELLAGLRECGSLRSVEVLYSLYRPILNCNGGLDYKEDVDLGALQLAVGENVRVFGGSYGVYGAPLFLFDEHYMLDDRYDDEVEDA